MKDYELKAKLEKELRWATMKYENYNSRLANAMKNFEDIQERHRLIEEETKKDINVFENEKAIFFEVMKERETSLNNLGKVRCDYCEKWFTTQGIKSHSANCTLNPEVIQRKEMELREREEQKRMEEEAQRAETERLRLLQEEEQRKELETLVEERKEASQELNNFKRELNGETEEIAWLQENHMDWIREYMEEEGGNAIWRGVITKGFRTFLENKNYKIGE